MSDAQVDGADNGQAAEDTVGGFIGEQDNAGAVRWFGIWSTALSLGSIVLYITFNNTFYIAMSKKYWESHAFVYGAVMLAWLMVSFFDGPLMREIFKDIVAASMFAPFFLEWEAIVEFIWAGDTAGVDGSSTSYD